MTGRRVFYSFHYDNDVMRVQQIRNIGALESNQPVQPNTWEALKRQGAEAVKKWIRENIDGKSCVVVLIGEETASRPYVRYEIEYACNSGKGVVGIYIHNLKDPNRGRSRKGANPFEAFTANGQQLSQLVVCYDPRPADAYSDIAENLEGLIEDAIQRRSTW